MVKPRTTITVRIVPGILEQVSQYPSLLFWEQCAAAGNMITFFHLEDTPMAKQVEAQAKVAVWS